jgi:proteasome lid subunit RPN8/RPN11
MLRLSQALRAELAARIVAGYPHETCGLLVGRASGTGGAVEARVERVVEARNLNTARARDRFELDPADWVRADDAARADGLDIVGIWHSHPDHPAEPSETDRLAAHEGYSYLIVNVTRDGVGAMRSWRLAEQRFHEESLDP